MKNFKNIHNFSSFLNERENADTDVAELVQDKVEAMSPEQKEQAKKELLNTAKALGLRPEDLTDSKKVQEALAKKASSLKESQDLNEGIKDWFKKISAKAMQLFGASGLIGGIITLAVNAELQSAATIAADYSGKTVNPGMTAVIAGTAIAIGTLAMSLGLHKASKEA